MPITTAQSFNRSLWRATAAQIVRRSVAKWDYEVCGAVCLTMRWVLLTQGRESIALNNKQQGFSTYWAPVYVVII
jgi:hypothetical protein